MFGYEYYYFDFKDNLSCYLNYDNTMSYYNS